MPAIRPIGHEDRLSLVEHLDELRKRLILCVVVFVVAFSFCYWQNDNILDLFNGPLESTQNLDRCNQGTQDPLEQVACSDLATGAFLESLGPTLAAMSDALERISAADGLSAADRALLARTARATADTGRLAREAADATPRNRERQPVTLGVTEPFVTTFTVAGYAALLLVLPFLLYQAYAFVLPAFSPAEKRVALPLMAMVPVLFMAGVAFGFFVALPRAVDFLQNFNDDSFDILLQARDYYKFSIVFLAVVGLLFQIPVGVLAVTRLGVVSARTLQRNRGYIILGISVVAAVATPTPDPVTMLIAMGPLVVLFELSVALARVFEKRRLLEPDDWELAADDEDEDEDPYGDAYDDALEEDDGEPYEDDDGDPYEDDDGEPREDDGGEPRKAPLS